MPHEIPSVIFNQHAETVALAWSAALFYVPIALGISKTACGAYSGKGSRPPMGEAACELLLLATGATPVGGDSENADKWIWPEAKIYKYLP